MDDFQKSCYDEAVSRGYDEQAAQEIVARVRRPESANLQTEPPKPEPEKQNA